MNTITFDTLEFTEQLKAAGVPEEQAKGHTKALATAMRQADVRTDELLANREKHAAGHLETLAEKNEKQVQSRLDGLATKQEMDYRLAALEASLKRDLAETKAETIKWIIGLALAQLAMMAGILMTMLRVLPGGH